MNGTFFAKLILAFYFTFFGTFRVAAQEKHAASASSHGVPDAKDVSQEVYRPYEFLIGDWDVKSEGDEHPMAVQHVRWGPNRSYIWYAVALLLDGREEPHLEGMLMWNGVHKNLDMLFAMDLKSGRVQEQGTLSVAPDGSLIRDITAVYSAGIQSISGQAVGAAGATAHFRQTYKQIGADKIATSATRETDHGWVATFPGSDHMIMTRRSG